MRFSRPNSLAAAMLAALIAGADATPARAQLSSDEIDRIDKELRDADQLTQSGKADEAIAHLEAIDKRVRPRVPANDPSIAAISNALGCAYARAQHLPIAERKLREALEIAAKHPEENGNLRLAVANNLIPVLAQSGKAAEAEELAKNLVEDTEKAYGKDSREARIARDTLVKLGIQAGRANDVIMSAREALVKQEGQQGADHPETIPHRHTLAVALMESGQYAEAERLLKESLRIAEARPAPELGSVAESTKVALLTLYTSMNRTTDAEALLKKYPELAAASGENARILVVQAINAQNAGQLAKSEALFQQALRISARKNGENHPEYASILANFAMLRCLQQRFDGATKLIEQSLAITASTPGTDSVPHAKSEATLALVYQRFGQLDKAAELLIHSSKILEEKLGPGHPYTDTALDNLAMVLVAQGRWDQAFDLLDRTRKSRIAHVHRVLPALSANAQIQTIASTERASRDTALALALDRGTEPNVPARSAEWLLNSKAITIQALASRAAIARAGGDPNTKQRDLELRKVQEQLAQWTFANDEAHPDFLNSDAYQKLIDQERELTSQLGLGPRLPAGGKWVDLPRIQSQLPSDAVLVEFAKIHWVIASPNPGMSGELQIRYAAWVIPPAGRGEVAIVNLGPASDIERSLDKALEAIQRTKDAKADQQAEVGREAADALKELGMKLYEPLRTRLEPARHWVLSPDGGLWLVPWAALPVADGRFAIEDHLIQLTVSGRELLSATAPSASSSPPTIFADPDYDLGLGQTQAPARERKHIPKSFDRLEYSKAEAQAIESSLERLTKTKPQLFLEDKALEANFKSLRSPRILVLSTHGFYIPDPKLNIMPFFPDMAPSISDAPANPLLRCGLAMAGYNRPYSAEPRADFNDGLLSGLEILGVDISNTELVVLSACDTALGDIQAGEGVAGLRQAFQLAGAATVVATLWKVKEIESSQLTSAMFNELAQNRKPAAALREAQLALIADRRRQGLDPNPYYWAAFSVTGSPWVGTEQPASDSPWADFAILAVLTPIAGAAARWWWRRGPINAS